MPLLKRWLPVVAWSAVILLTSNDHFSSVSTRGWLDGLLGKGLPALVNVAMRKLAHVGAYGFLAFLTFRAARMDFRRPILAAFVVVLLIATIDEWHQSTTRLRGGSPWDVLLDLCGAAIAVSLIPGARVSPSRPSGAE